MPVDRDARFDRSLAGYLDRVFVKVITDEGDLDARQKLRCDPMHREKQLTVSTCRVKDAKAHLISLVFELNRELQDDPLREERRQKSRGVVLTVALYIRRCLWQRELRSSHLTAPH